MISDLALVFDRDIASLQSELATYPDDAAVWATVTGQPNTAGTLVLHLSGNLRHFIGATLGGSGYQRDRDLEFSRRNVSRDELHRELDATRAEVAAAFNTLSGDILDQPYPILVGKGIQTTNGRMLIHLLAHLAYHLGQIDYARRAVTGESTSAGVQPMPAIATAI